MAVLDDLLQLLGGGDPEAAGAAQASTAMQPWVDQALGYGNKAGEAVLPGGSTLGRFARDYVGQRAIPSAYEVASIPSEWAPGGTKQPGDPAAIDDALSVALSTLVPGRPPGSAGMGIRAFHGSPHSFDRFDLSKIGTGEGAQAYGHGLYFAENEPVALQYRNAVKDNSAIAALNDQMSGVSKEIDKLGQLPGSREWADPRWPEYDRLKAEYDRLMQQREATVSAPGHMYEVDINAKPEDFLRWDQPLGQQSPTVQGAVEKLFAGNPEIQSALPPATGESIIRRLMPMSGYGRGGPEVRPDVISQTLGEAGIPGTRYADQGSRIDPVAIQRKIAMYQDYLREPSLDPAHRADWTNRVAELQAELVKPQTSNYAIWTPEIITILRRYGLLPPLAADGLLAAPGQGEAAQP